jgi:hypothetical protein
MEKTKHTKKRRIAHKLRLSLLRKRGCVQRLNISDDPGAVKVDHIRAARYTSVPDPSWRDLVALSSRIYK